MSDISNIYSSIGANYQSYNNYQKASQSKNDVTSKAPSNNNVKKSDKSSTENTVSKSKISGKTVGNPQLSEKAASYYDELKKKFSDMDFILVSKDQKEYAKANAASFGSSSKMIVLIGEDEVERMANDESFRAKYEGIIEKAANSFSAFADSLASTGASVKNYGMQVNDDGTVSYFAVLEKSSELQKERIEKKAAEKQAAKKADAKKAQKKEAQERLEKSKESTKADKFSHKNDTEKVTFEADSMEELLRKVQDFAQANKSETVITDSERALGGSIDFSA